MLKWLLNKLGYVHHSELDHHHCNCCNLRSSWHLVSKYYDDAIMKQVEDDSIVIKLKILDPGDWSVGIRSIDDDMEIKLPKWILADDVKSEVEDICKFFQGFFDIQSVVTLDEYEADLKRQNDLYDKIEREDQNG